MVVKDLGVVVVSTIVVVVFRFGTMRRSVAMCCLWWSQ
jgi:hypothetical protein